MPRKSVYFTDEQWPRVAQAAQLEGRSVSQWVRRALEAALSEAKDPGSHEQSGSGSVPSEVPLPQDGVRPATLPRARVLPGGVRDELPPAPQAVEDACIHCRAAGSPRSGHRACTCGYTGPKDPNYKPKGTQ